MRLAARAAFGNIEYNPGPGRGVIATERSSLAIVRVAARQGRLADLTARVESQFGITPPAGPALTQANGLAFIGIGIETWLVTAERDPDEIIGTLRAALDHVATVSDQSGGYAVLRLTGLKLREALGKLLTLDLHTREFSPGTAACTLASHIPLTLWRLNDGAEGPVFEIAVPRSFTASFNHLLSASAAEFGLVLTA